MDFRDALILAQSNEHLVGKIYRNERIDDLLIIPVHKCERELFIKSYVRSLDAQQSIVPFMKCDVEVCALVQKNMIRRLRLFPVINILQLPIEMGVINT